MFIYYRKTKWDKALVLMVYFVVVSVIMTYCTYLTFHQEENTFIYNYFLLPVSIIGIPLYFYFLFKSRAKKKIAIILITINLLVFFLQHLLFFNTIFFDSIGFATLSLTVVFLSLVFYQQLIKNVTDQSLFTKIDFWIVCSFILYYSGSFAVFLTYYYLSNKVYSTNTYMDSYTLTILWGIPNVLLLVSAIFTLFGTAWINYHKKLQ